MSIVRTVLSARVLIPGLLLVALAGCGLSPQTIDMHPTPEVKSANIGHNQPVKVTVTDRRAQAAFGSRGGVYKDTSLIRPQNNVAQSIQGAVVQGLQTLGFNAYNPGDNATQLTVDIQDISYQPENDVAMPGQVTVKAVLKATAQRGDTSHIGVYRTSVDHRTVVTPSAKKNEEMLNDVVDRALQHLLSDPKMLSFLAGETPPSAPQQ